MFAQVSSDRRHGVDIGSLNRNFGTGCTSPAHPCAPSAWHTLSMIPENGQKPGLLEGCSAQGPAGAP
jgi:hypothetical protein